MHVKLLINMLHVRGHRIFRQKQCVANIWLLAMNLLLDTCVVIDYRGRKEPFFPAAERIMAVDFFIEAIDR